MSPWMLALVIFTALNSLLSLAYYAPMVNRLYRKQPAEIVAAGEKVPAAIVIPMVAAMLGVIVLGVFPELVAWLTGPAAAQLAAAFGS